MPTCLPEELNLVFGATTFFGCKSDTGKELLLMRSEDNPMHQETLKLNEVKVRKTGGLC
jgi:hypothetical protein